MPLRGDGKRSTATGSCSTTWTSSCTCSRPEARDFYRLEQLWGQVPARQYASA